MTAFLVIVGAMGSLKGHRSQGENNLIAAGIILYVFFFNLAWGPLAWVVATELSGGKNRQKIMSVGTACFWLSAFVVTFTLPYLYDATEAGLEAQIGYIYAGGSAIAMAFVYFFIPETLGRSLEEINRTSKTRLSLAHFLTIPSDLMDAQIPARSWAAYDLAKEVEHEVKTKGDRPEVQHVEKVSSKQEV